MDATDPRESAEPALVGGDPSSELVGNFSETARALFSATGVRDTLALVVELAVDTIEGCDFAGIFFVQDDVVSSPIHTDLIVGAIEGVQQDSGEGPCLDAMNRRLVFYAEDIADDPRWPRFGPAAHANGIRSVLALPLTPDGNPGALNLYARYPAAFGVADRARAVILASLAGLAVSVARSHEDEERRAENLNTALATREVIGQAQGILMERERISSDQAFDILRRASQHLNRKLRDVAQDLVETGTTPETGAPEHF